MEKKSGGMGVFGILGIIFVVLKVLGIGMVANWSWWLVLSPLWGGAAFILIVLGIVLLIAMLANR